MSTDKAVITISVTGDDVNVSATISTTENPLLSYISKEIAPVVLMKVIALEKQFKEEKRQ
ncbi:hypothetical protein [Trabulsiella odontotermitis]|uniref:hypothetical protein n=1 Tax=Trabulsiella odontotermitis TaxID=379893 RepID=UPI0006760653|nr:hypothetical protein [Trabulsiella odontotermitis]KNC89685.1 hypothetical protein GM30_06620 [Trabulsiella odontotermitis]